MDGRATAHHLISLPLPTVGFAPESVSLTVPTVYPSVAGVIGRFVASLARSQEGPPVRFASPRGVGSDVAGCGALVGNGRFGVVAIKASQPSLSAATARFSKRAHK